MAKRTVKRRKLTKYSIGDMRDRISIEIKSQSVGFDTPEAIQSFTVLATVWAQVDTIEAGGSHSPGDQYYNRVNLDPVTFHIFTIRYRNDLNASNIYIRWKGTLYRIHKIKNPEENSQYLSLICRKEGDDILKASQ